ncbi:hypothetical protein DS891_01385 [Pseudoalteromonas sp. JC28]|uniref:nucleotidyltransferase domain-containing protein n=1 Tax=Pseudoalteromonas sp. JC28 TaxID=2267617 RepID=UPI001571EE70|nr:nucleotidyltransferase domain-containing protein [Pseudoalteromonas sp. JC28]NSY32261.1 hypothetical protein [Pseudoalteromonas sp. JC28]
MSASKVAIHLINNCLSLKYFDAYMFGSTLKGVGRDIDILIVGPSGRALSSLKEEMLIASRELPLDVLYMLPSEAIQTDFIRQKGCIELTTLAKKR